MSTMHGRQAVRWPLIAGLVVTLLLTTVGCRSMHGREHQQRMDEISAEIQAEIATYPDVTEVSVGYTDYFLDTPAAGATIFIRSGADPDPVADEAVRLIWLSEMAPLHTISVSVQDATTKLSLTNRVLSPDGKDQAQLEREYGPRPKQSG